MAFSARPYNRTSMVNSITVASGATSGAVPVPPAKMYTVFVYPDSGATVSVYLIGSSDAAVAAGTHNRQAWSEGAVSEDTVKVVDGPLTAIEVSSASAGATVEIVTI